MKQVLYYCNICKKKITNPKAELDCMAIDMDYTKNWETDLPITRKVKDLRVCKECGEKVEQFINSIIVNGGNE